MLPENTFGKRLRSLVLARFPSVKSFIEACNQIDSDLTPGESMMTKYFSGGSMPALDRAAVFSRALHISLDELAGIEKPRQKDSTVADLAREARGYGPESVELVRPPNSTIHPGYAFGSPGNEQLIVDFLVIRNNQRHVIPFGEHRPQADKET